MAVLKRRKDGGLYVQGPGPDRKYCTWQVTPQGAEELEQAGIQVGDSIPRDLHFSLCETKDLYTSGSGPGDEAELLEPPPEPPQPTPPPAASKAGCGCLPMMMVVAIILIAR